MTSEQALKQHLEMADQHEQELAKKEERELYGMTIEEMEQRKPECRSDAIETANCLKNARICLTWAVDPANITSSNAGESAIMFVARAHYFLNKITKEQRRKDQAKNETF